MDTLLKTETKPLRKVPVRVALYIAQYTCIAVS